MWIEQQKQPQQPNCFPQNKRPSSLFCHNLVTMDVARDSDGCTGSARRRRERRMRFWWRREPQSIRMALAAASHHSFGQVHTEDGAPRGQGEEHELPYTVKVRDTPLFQPKHFDVCDEELGGGLPPTVRLAVLVCFSGLGRFSLLITLRLG